MSRNLDRSVRKAQAGDVEAFGEIVAEHERSIRAWLISRCPPGGDADDVAQKVFIQAFRRLEEFEAGTDLKAWLFAIAKFQLMAECTRLRRQADYHSRYVPVALSAQLEQRISVEPAEVPRELEDLRECVRQLDQRGRELLGLRYSSETPLAEIAESTGRSVGAIKKHLYVLRQKLQECIKQKVAARASL
ncbi:sigma-70 family RNA polymerase sigma factor [Stratiformator vulcanicus]|uniref:RNA polymerase sigma factor n=1 Tax=Stratiformator vulcanicus TaxID=2527980 RepID=A0A517QWL5_9PLAN|nr:sigma-70 family RNA polymerase sigma factor [Stratiformator vulcanicus]QDT36065.1 ECF RNA polymerase sigma-E factor [Stratiformator vulcanicus]